MHVVSVAGNVGSVTAPGIESRVFVGAGVTSENSWIPIVSVFESVASGSLASDCANAICTLSTDQTISNTVMNIDDGFQSIEGIAGIYAKR